MLLPKATSDTAAVRIAELLTAELAQAAERKDFGVLVQDVTPLDRDAFLHAVAQQKATRGKRLRVALVGAVEEVARARERWPSLADVLSPDEQSAVTWRNQWLRTIAVVADRPLALSATLRDFRVIGERDLARRLCSEQRDAAEVNWLRTLWDALHRGKGLRIALIDVVRYAETLHALPSTERSAQAPRYLHVLGLFPDAHLADEKSDQRILRRLQLNHDLVQLIRRASNEDWNRLRLYCRSLSGRAKPTANGLLRRLRELSQDGSLEGLDFADVQTLWRAKVGGGPGRGNETRGPRRVEVERVVGRMLMSDDDASLGDVAEEIRQIAQASLEDDSRVSTQDIKQASGADEVTVVDVDRDLLTLVRSHTTQQFWGGVIEVASDKPAALTEVSAFKTSVYFRIEPLLTELKKFVDGEIAPQGILEAVGRLVDLRAKLLPYVCDLTLSPVATLAGSATLCAAAEEYLEGYEHVLRQVHGCYQDMHSAADFEAESVISQLLCLELYVYHRDGQIEAVMSPLHPLYLWRSVVIVRDLRGLGRVLSEHERQTLEDACADDLHFLQVLVLPRQATGAEQPMMLGQAGALGRLPLFREAPRGMLETDGVRTIGDLAQRLAKLRPFVRPGLHVMLVNVPHPVKFLEELLGRLELEDTSADDTFWGIHVRIRYTDSDTRGWANEINDIDDDIVREKLTAGEERGLLTLSIKPETIDWDTLRSELKAQPAHLTVVVDPFKVRSIPVARANVHTLNPWMPTCEYRFNRISKDIQVIPIAEEHVFGSYLATASLVHTALQRKTPAHLPQVREVKDQLDKLADASTWFVIADPHRVPLFRMGDAEVIDRRIERGRQLTCFAHDLSPFVRRLQYQLRLTHFDAESPTLERLVRDLVAMEPNGILSIASTNQETHVKGSLGKVIAVRWYRMRQPSGLAVSLDTENAQRWLVAGQHSHEKADLLGLREEDGEVIIDVIEVKAHDEAVPYTLSATEISGRPVGQVLATLHALAEVFSPDNASPLVKPRREVLREHLYTALLRDQQPEYVERWHTLLQDMFDGKVRVRLAGRIVHVQLASVAKKDAKTFLTREGIPIRVDTLSAQDVGFVLRSVGRRDVAPEPTEEQRGVAHVQETLDPAKVLERLVHTSQDSAATLVLQTQLTLGSSAEQGHDGVTLDGSRESAALEPNVTGDVSESSESSRLVLQVVLGTEHASGNEVVWQPGRQSNGFFLILGASGSGKTETLKVLGSSIAGAGVPVLVFDFHGDVVFPGLATVLLSSGSASRLGLNPMALDAHSAEESGLYDQRAALRGMIARAVPALGHRQSAVLREAFEEAYRAAGINDGDPETWSRPAPTFRNVQAILATWAEADDRKSQRPAIDGCLAAVQQLFDHPIFQREQHVSVDEMLTSWLRLDLSKLPDDVRFIATETLLRRLFRVLRLRGPIPVQPSDDRQRFRLFVVIDEAKILSLGGGDRDRSDSILNELVTEARKFGLGMILASQMSDHFSEEVRANAATWLVLKPMDIKEAKRNAPNVSVDAEDLIHLRGQGDGYYRDRPSTRARRIQVRPLHL